MSRTLRAFVRGQESERGQAIIVIALTMLAMLMMVGVAIDAGQLYSARRAMQEAADAAAYAGSVTLYQQVQQGIARDQVAAFAAARADATTNGYTDNGNDVRVYVQQPTAAPYNTNDYVEVIIEQKVRTFLVPAEAGITNVTVRAISGAESFNNQYAMIALDRNAWPGSYQNGPTASITLHGGGIMVNSSANLPGNAAANAQLGATWSISCTAANPCQVDIVGASDGTWPAARPGAPPAGAYYNGVFTGKPPTADPFAGYPKPSTANMLVDPPANGTTLFSGIYDYTLTGKKLCHGIYILKAGTSGSLTTDTTTLDPNTNQICDGRVLIFNTLTNYPGTGGTCSGITVAGNNEVDNLKPMTTGTYAGMLVYQDPACTAAMVLSGSAAEMDVQGTIYLPNADFQLNGHAEVQGGQIVAKHIDLGNGQVGLDFSAANSARPVLPRLAK